MQDFEKLGVFYLGKEYDLVQKQRLDNLILYDAKDLVTHAVCVGMTGSGKTGLCIGLLEEAALDGIPSLIIDPKGDLPNLLLAFPNLSAQDFRPWVNEQEAARKGLTPDEFAAAQAELWRKGLAEWGQDGDRIARLRAAAEFTVYTPGSTAGRPVSILGSFSAPPVALRQDEELLRDRVANAASGLLSLVGIDPDPIKSREHILVSTVLQHAWSQGRDLDLSSLIQSIQAPPVSTVGVMDIESFYPAKDRFALAMLFNNLLAAPGFSAWLSGDPLDVGRLLYTAEGRPRVSIMSIAHLSDTERMFFVTLLLNEVLSWTRAQPGTSSLRALLYMDEIFGYFPPIANPPSKTPLLTLLKQARAFGVGVVLATQNPVDLDYKGLSNTGTWFIGRLQTERDKARVLEGLEGVAAGTAAGFDRNAMESILAGLGSRVFLMYNVHEDAPVIFQTRWTMSYLAGPLTRVQIRLLGSSAAPSETQAVGAVPVPTAAQPTVAAPAATTAPVTAAMAAPVVTANVVPAPPVASAPATPALGADTVSQGPPLLPPDVPAFYLPVTVPAPTGASLLLTPGLAAVADVHFRDTKRGVTADQTVAALTVLPESTLLVDWEAAEFVDLDPDRLSTTPPAGASFLPLPAAAGKAANYRAWQKEFADWLYRTQSLRLKSFPPLKLVADPEETEGAFRARVQLKQREARDEMVEKLRRTYAPKLAALDERIRRAQQVVEREEEQARGQKLQTAISFGATLLGAFTGRKLASTGNLGRATTAVRGVGRSMDQIGDVARAKETLEAARRARLELEDEFSASIAELEAELDAAQQAGYEDVDIRPKKTDIRVRFLALAWIPVWESPTGERQPAWR